MSAVVHRTLILIEALLVGAFLADATFGLTDRSVTLDLLLAAGFAILLTWDLRRR